MGLDVDVRGREENRLAPQSHVVLTTMIISDRPRLLPAYAPSNTRTTVFLGDGASCKHVYGAEFWVGKLSTH